MLMKAGVHSKVAADHLGHSRVQITLDYYTYTNEEIQRETSEKICGFFKKFIKIKIKSDVQMLCNLGKYGF